MGSLEELTNSKRRALALMGIPLYFKRVGQQETMASIAPGDQSLENTASVPEAVAAPDVVVAPEKREVAPGQREVALEDQQASQQPTAKTEMVAPIRFDWLQGTSGLLCVDQIPSDRAIAAHDVVQFMDWQMNEEGAGGAKLASDTFQWPQLTATDSGPARPLTVFFNKYASATGWVLVDRYVADEVLTHLPELTWTTLVIVDDLGAALTDPQGKLALWQKLAK